MTPSDRIKAIEDTFYDELAGEDIEWLINRVKRLTEALEVLTDETKWNPANVSKMARKALEGDE